MSCPYYTFRQNDYYCIKKQDYVNSDCYYRYCRNYSYDECPIYKNSSSSSGGCYLTSACVGAKGLPDDCHELETLRRFRDGWLKAQEGGEETVLEYYRVAPAIVEAVNSREDAAEIWERVYRELVLPCVALIEQEKNQEAYKLYRKITVELREYISAEK